MTCTYTLRPTACPRNMDDIDMTERITASTPSGYAIKNHWTSTADRAKLINRLYPGCEAIGTITHNSAVGGLNPTAVEMAARGGVKLVWFPTCDNEHKAAYQFDGNPNKKLAFWASIILEMKEQGIQTPTRNCLNENGELKKKVLDILDIVASYDCIIGTDLGNTKLCYPDEGMEEFAEALMAESLTGMEENKMKKLLALVLMSKTAQKDIRTGVQKSFHQGMVYRETLNKSPRTS